jgi:STE24 endopeptidase
VHWFTYIFLLALAVHLLGHLWLSRRQARHVSAHSSSVPADFAAVVSPEEHRRAASYTQSRQELGQFESVYDTLVLLGLTLGGGIAWLGRLTADLATSSVLTGTAHVLAVMAALALLGLPFSIYRTFWLEQRFGFNRTTPRVFVSDLAKGWVLGAVIGAVIVAAILLVMRETGDAWWLVAWAVWLAFSLLVTWAWPTFIAPLFNKFTPLADAALRERIESLLARCDFRAKAVYVMDGSRRSTHGNAYFTGLGREKRIVFFDTLLDTLTPPQVESVLAHELAHFKLKHIPQRLLVGAAASFAGFALLGWLARQPVFYSALGVPSPSDSSALLLFVFVAPLFTWFLTPLSAAWSRRHEYQADDFAAQHSNAHDLADALVRLYRDNANTLTPDPLYSAMFDSHPPPAARVRRLRLGPAASSGTT